jgi:hypothetical protein
LPRFEIPGVDYEALVVLAGQITISTPIHGKGNPGGVRICFVGKNQDDEAHKNEHYEIAIHILHTPLSSCSFQDTLVEKRIRGVLGIPRFGMAPDARPFTA